MHVTDCCHMPEHFRGCRHLSELQQYQSAVGADAQGKPSRSRPTRLQNELTSHLNVAIDTGTIARLTDPQQSPGNKQLLIDDKVKQLRFPERGTS